MLFHWSLIAVAVIAKAVVASPVDATNLDSSDGSSVENRDDLSAREEADNYYKTFSDLHGATLAKDYLTFGLVDCVADCKKMCDKVPKCEFVNTYHDVNGKNGSPKLTCALFTKCHTESDATNFGGQKQLNGKLNCITDSDGWCKKKY